MNESDNPLLQSIASGLSWPEKPLGFSLHARWVPEKSDHGQWYVNFGYQATDSLRVGLDLRPLTDDLSILANWRVFPENETWRPALIVGTSNDDFGPINSQAYYATFSKKLFDVADISFSPYAGAVYIEALDEVRPVGGLHLRRGAWSALLMYSGVHEHLSVSRDFGNHTLTLLLFDLKLPGVAYSFRF